MTNTICGHDRDILRFGIQVLALSDNATAYADQIERDHNSTERIKAATRALVDPVKLAEMLAELLRERGVDIGEPGPLYSWGRWFGEAGRLGAWMSVSYGYIHIHSKTPSKMFVELDGIQSRALTLRLLQWEGEFDLVVALRGEQ